MNVNESEIREIQNSIEEYLVKNKMKNVKVIIHQSNESGVNYISTVLKASSSSERNGEAFDERYVIKVLKDDKFIQSDERVNNNQMLTWSICEEYAYEVVLPAMFALQKKHNVETDYTPAEYVTAQLRKDSQFLIFKDLTSSGFTLRDRNLMLDTEHVALVIRRLAQFHAFSMALKHLDPEKYREVTAVNLEEKLFDENSLFHDFFIDAANLQLALFIENVESSEVRGKLIKMKECFPELCKKLATNNHAAPYSVIGHGDVWSNNVMFKYNDNKLVDAVLLDWQVIRHNSPVLDLFHLITTSIDESLQNAEGFDFIISTYYKNLSDELNKYSLDSNVVYPKDIFWAHLRTYTPLGLRIGLVMWPFHCRMYEDTVSVTEVLVDINKLLDMSTESKDRYNIMWDFLLDVFNKNEMLDI